MTLVRILPFIAVVALASAGRSVAGVVINSVTRSADAHIVGHPSDPMTASTFDGWVDAFSGGPLGQATAGVNPTTFDPINLILTGEGIALVQTFRDSAEGTAKAVFSVLLTLDQSYQFSYAGTLDSTDFFTTIASIENGDESGSLFYAADTAFTTGGVLSAGKYWVKASSEGSVQGHKFALNSGTFNVKFTLEPITSNVVPEPASIAVWCCLGLTAAGVQLRRGRKLSVAG